ncbi:hypothetical protein KPL70_009721 [Citrus sinensis]|uniref:Uncharacterized protein n=1 Tax=Citrus sinensis TaxID=2711 RepID=A0ACB8MM44_CITSI|nr:hypothetical protein KPL70_009721 [Citrus sinensis]KAH9786657.1 hypothetical protein KPL71_010333 [Citrus sinensis]
MQGLQDAIAGTSLYVVSPNDDFDDVKKAAIEEMKSVTKAASEGISIGPVHKKDVVTASIMLDKKKEYAAILAFDVKVTSEAQELANKLGVKIAA